jgi:cysteine desulfurase
MNMPVYLDNNATTAVAPEVVEAMLPYLREFYGNPSSPHRFARGPAVAVAKARDQVARLVNAPAESLVFTSGGTESNAMAISDALARDPFRNEVILSAVEHASVWAWRERLASRGVLVHVIPVDRNGQLDLGVLAGYLSPRTALVSVMMANNETGVVYPVKKIAELAHRAGALMHTDAVQTAGKILVNLADHGVDYASLCGHKYHAVKGMGIIYTRATNRYTPLMLGGEQEFGRRPGTEPVASVVAMGRASELAGAWLAEGGDRALAAKRDAFEDWLAGAISGVVIAGRGGDRLPNTTLALIPGVETEPLLALLDMEGLACSSGSACASGAHEPSHVLKAMGYSEASGAVLRVSSSRYTTADEYRRLQEVLPAIVEKLRR